MMRLFAIFMITAMTSSPVWANQIRVDVKGMVCSFCTQGIAKNFKKNPAVKKVDVNFEEAKVTLALKDGADLADSEIDEVLADSGFSAAKITRE